MAKRSKPRTRAKAPTKKEPPRSAKRPAKEPAPQHEPAPVTPGSGPAVSFDTAKFENILQIGGIQVADLQTPIGSAQTCRVAIVNTGSPLRFVVALDRGGDIVEATYNEHSLTYLSPNGYLPPRPAYNRDLNWLRGWPGGLLTSCGPIHIGAPRVEDGVQIGLHGHHSNTPACVEMLINPDPHRGRHEMLLSMVIKDTRMFGPIVEVRRQIQCALGVPEIIIYDQVTNRGNERCAHNWLYHVNLGYPLLDKGARFIYAGSAVHLPTRRLNDVQINSLKKVTDPIDEHRGAGERVLMIDPQADGDGICHVGLINPRLNLGIELSYSKQAFPRLANWQHFGPGGSYVAGVEPFSGTLVGRAADDHPLAEQWLEPGQTRRYQATIRIHATRQALAEFAKFDGNLTVQG